MSVNPKNDPNTIIQIVLIVNKIKKIFKKK
jgi:hypothetical protein